MNVCMKGVSVYIIYMHIYNCILLMALILRLQRNDANKKTSPSAHPLHSSRSVQTSERRTHNIMLAILRVALQMKSRILCGTLRKHSFRSLRHLRQKTNIRVWRRNQRIALSVCLPMTCREEIDLRLKANFGGFDRSGEL